jgi:hypothetical protein
MRELSLYLGVFIAAVTIARPIQAELAWTISGTVPPLGEINGTITFSSPGDFAASSYAINESLASSLLSDYTSCDDGGALMTGLWNGGILTGVQVLVTDSAGSASFNTLVLNFDVSWSSNPHGTGTYQLAPISPRLTLTTATNVSLAASQVECGANTSPNPFVTGLAGGTPISYTATGSFTCCGSDFLADNLDDGDIGAVSSDGTYAISDSGSLFLDFGSAQTITSIAIYSGYANRDDGVYTLRDDVNNVLGAWTINTPTGSSNEGTVSYWLVFDTPVTTSSLTLELASSDVGNTVSFREIQALARPRITDATNITLAASQIESGPDTTENPDVTGGAGGALIAYTETASFTCCNGEPWLGDNLDDGDVGAGNLSDGSYAIPDSGTLVLDFGSTQTLGSIAIYNGYTNRDDGTYTLRDDANNVLGAWTIATLSNDTNDGVDSFWLTFKTPVTTSSLTLELVSADEDATVSFREIQVMGPGPSAVPAIGPLGRAVALVLLFASGLWMTWARRIQPC